MCIESTHFATQVIAAKLIAGRRCARRMASPIQLPGKPARFEFRDVRSPLVFIEGLMLQRAWDSEE